MVISYMLWEMKLSREDSRLREENWVVFMF